MRYYGAEIRRDMQPEMCVLSIGKSLIGDRNGHKHIRGAVVAAIAQLAHRSDEYSTGMGFDRSLIYRCLKNVEPMKMTIQPNVKVMLQSFPISNKVNSLFRTVARKRYRAVQFCNI